MGRKFTNFALFYFVFEDKFQVQAPPGGLYSEGRFNGGFLRYHFGGLIFWRGRTDMYAEVFPRNVSREKDRNFKGFLLITLVVCYKNLISLLFSSV